MNGVAEAKRYVSGADVVTLCARAWGLTESDVFSRYRHADMCESRNAIAFLLRHKLFLSYPASSRIGHTSHSVMLDRVRRASLWIREGRVVRANTVDGMREMEFRDVLGLLGEQIDAMANARRERDFSSLDGDAA